MSLLTTRNKWSQLANHVTDLSPVVIGKVHYLLWGPRALDGHWREGKDGVASLESLEVFKGFWDSLGRVVASHPGVGIFQGFRKTFDLCVYVCVNIHTCILLHS